METIDTLYFGDVASKIAHAYRLFRDYGRRLLGNPQVTQGVKELKRLGDRLNGVMHSLGMPEQCSHCGDAFNGGCCSGEMAGETDALLLLINLLAGGGVQEQERDGFECRFLGINGCVLRFKPFLCLNYICRKMRDGQDPEQRKALADATAALLSQIVTLEGLILQELGRGQ
jgi:hypothetical protein